MTSLLEIYETIFETALGADFIARYPDLLGLVALVATVGTCFGFVYAVLTLIKRFIRGRKG